MRNVVLIVDDMKFNRQILKDILEVLIVYFLFLLNYLNDIDIMMVPINGRSFYKLRDDIIGNMTIEEAVILAKECHADMLIPMHYDLYDVNCVNPAYFVDHLYRNNPTQKFHMFVPGERFVYSK